MTWMGVSHEEHEDGTVTLRWGYDHVETVSRDEKGRGWCCIGDYLDGPRESLQAALTHSYDRAMWSEGIVYKRRPWPKPGEYPVAVETKSGRRKK